MRLPVPRSIPDANYTQVTNVVAHVSSPSRVCVCVAGRLHRPHLNIIISLLVSSPSSFWVGPDARAGPYATGPWFSFDVGPPDRFDHI